MTDDIDLNQLMVSRLYNGWTNKELERREKNGKDQIGIIIIIQRCKVKFSNNVKNKYNKVHYNK